VSAEILNFSDYRDFGDYVGDGADVEIDLVTAVDVAIRDLREILLCWGSEMAQERAQECELMLRRAYSGFVFGQPGAR
jgi:hypothetical protein